MSSFFRFFLGRGFLRPGKQVPARRFPQNLPLETWNLKLETLPAMNRIVEKFIRLKSAGKKGFIAYIGAGDPNLTATLGTTG